MNTTNAAMPTVVRFALTKPAPCALLLVLMFSMQLWLPQWFSSVPALALMVAFICMGLNFFSPALMAVVTLGGGLRFVAQAGTIAYVMVFFIPNIGLAVSIMFGILYILLPTIAARGLTTPLGITRASDTMVAGALLTAVVGLLVIVQTQNITAHEWVNQLIEPLFSAMRDKPNAISEQEVIGIQSLLGWTLPGILAFSLWLMWGINIAVARRIAMHYGFYHGDPRPVLQLQPGIWCGWLLLLALVVANVVSGDLQYIGVTIALLLAGVMAQNGISIAHLWLRTRGLTPVIVLMYGLLMFMSMIIFPFIVLGLIDLWSNYRNKFDHSIDLK